MKVFDCSKYKIEKAKMLANKRKGFSFPQKGTMEKKTTLRKSRTFL